MQFANFIILSIGAIASVEAVSCWKSGPEVKEEDIAPSIPTICNYLSAVYVKDENRYQCVQDLAGVKWDFALTLISDVDQRPMTSGECQDGMYKQIKCKYGGETSYGNWKYRADPNSGRCVG